MQGGWRYERHKWGVQQRPPSNPCPCNQLAATSITTLHTQQFQHAHLQCPCCCSVSKNMVENSLFVSWHLRSVWRVAQCRASGHLQTLPAAHYSSCIRSCIMTDMDTGVSVDSQKTVLDRNEPSPHQVVVEPIIYQQPKLRIASAGGCTSRMPSQTTTQGLSMPFRLSILKDMHANCASRKGHMAL